MRTDPHAPDGLPPLLRRRAGSHLRGCAALFLDEAFAAEVLASCPEAAEALDGAAARAAAVVALGDPATLDEFYACLEAIERSVVDVQAAARRLPHGPGLSVDQVRAAVREHDRHDG